MIPLRTKCSATRPRPAPRATSIELQESTTDPAEVAAMRRNIPAGCPVSTRDPLPGLSTDIPIIVLSSSDDKARIRMYKKSSVAAHDLLLVTIHIIYICMEIADELVEEASTRINMLQHDEISRLQRSSPLASRLNKSRRKPSLKLLLNCGTPNLSPEGSDYGSKDSTKVDPDWQYSCCRIESSAKRLKTLCLNTQQSQVVFQGREKCFAKPTEDQYGLGRRRDQNVQQGL
ncbi:hypothetical protein BDL97_10G024600 [Sphagnum fallax]|nr:hypothetical protein BDL97_10G024600 [Sphagnum fallax]KAH8949287.1 hypothetical protein BDL97_10G024600 [Sphagnum fallax]KAH8949288.1 hypothetical protein BDL97_10G024600 [Sphagnum fallax]